MIKGIIFDLDGVLVFTDKYHYQAWKKIADEENIYFDEIINNRLRGVSRRDSLEIILEKAQKTYTEEEKDALCEKKNNLLKTLLYQLSPESVQNETRELLEFLKKSDIKLAIGSSSKNTQFILEQTDLKKYFDYIVDGTKITHSKPDKEVFYKALLELNLPKEEVLVVEDAKSGIDAAHNAGIKAIGIGDAEQYDKTDYPIKNLKEIIDIASRGIVISHLKKIYPNGFEAVKDFSLEIDDKEFVVFVGPSGCGKSTVLRMIAGLEEITSGELYIDGILANNQESKQRNIAMVFQNYALYPHYTVRQNIGFPLLIEKIPFKKKFDFEYRKQRKQSINEKIIEVASKIGLSDYLDVKPQFLSGGQRQRVALGRVIIRNPRCFLFDEPLSNLDAKMRTQMRAEISKLHKELQKTFIYVTHDQVEAMTMGSKIVVMKLGVIQQVSSPSELYNHPCNLFVAGFIGTPQMNFIDCTIKAKEDGYHIINESFDFIMPEHIKDIFMKEYVDKEVILGIRPKAISTKADLAFNEKNIVKVKTNIIEQLGDDKLLYATLLDKDVDIILSTNPDADIQINDEIEISFDLSHMCLFDKESQNTVLDYKLLK